MSSVRGKTSKQEKSSSFWRFQVIELGILPVSPDTECPAPSHSFLLLPEQEDQSKQRSPLIWKIFSVFPLAR